MNSTMRVGSCHRLRRLHVDHERLVNPVKADAISHDSAGVWGIVKVGRGAGTSIDYHKGAACTYFTPGSVCVPQDPSVRQRRTD